MTASNIDGDNLINSSFRPKAIEQSMMIIEENSSEQSSPKKFITASGFI